MGRFILKICIFFVLVAVVDFASGFVFDMMRANAKGGSTRLYYYINEQSEDDIVILGPSRAMNHYVSSIIQDSTGLGTINCGQSGNGIIGAYARYSAIRERHVPRLVIYETLPTYDYLESDPYSAYLWIFRPYYKHSAVRELFGVFGDKIDNLELYSSLYRNNSSYLVYLKDMFVQDDGFRGFRPLFGTMTDEEVASCDTTVHIWDEDKAQGIKADSLRLQYMEKLFKMIKADGASLVCIISPFYSYPTLEEYAPVLDLCKRTGVDFVDYSCMDGIAGKREYFLNSGHLNDDGAREYTRRILPLIRKYLKIL